MPLTVSQTHSAADGGAFCGTSQSPIISTSLQENCYSLFPILARRFEITHFVKMRHLLQQIANAFRRQERDDMGKLKGDVVELRNDMGELKRGFVNLSKAVTSLSDLREDLREGLRKDLREGLRKDLREDLREDLRKDLGDLHNAVQGVREDLRNVHEDIRKADGTIAKEVSKKITVALMASDFCFGHGTLLKGKEGPQDAVLFTAAHVALDAKSYHECGRFSKIRFANGQEYNIANKETFKLELFIHYDYIRTGIQDYAGVRLKFDGEYHYAFQDLAISQAHPFESEFYGRSTEINFRSNAIRIVKEDRVQLSAPSVSGCSGTPLFSSSGELNSVLHGETKHRTKLHSRDDSEPNSEPNSKPDGMSTFVHVDIVREIGNLPPWSHKLVRCLCKLEMLDEKEAKDPSKKLIVKDASNQAKEFFREAESLFPAQKEFFNQERLSVGAVCDMLVEENEQLNVEDSRTLETHLERNLNSSYKALCTSSE